jgi:hypothetical protein
VSDQNEVSDRPDVSVSVTFFILRKRYILKYFVLSMRAPTYLPVIQYAMQCLRKVFRSLKFFHILLGYSLILKLFK